MGSTLGLAVLGGLVLATALGAVAEPPPPTAPRQPLAVLLFAASTCPGCDEIKQQLFPRLGERFGEAVRFEHIALDDVDRFELLLLYEKRYGVKDDEALKVFVGQAYLSGREGIHADLETAIAEQLARGTPTPLPDEVRREAEGLDQARSGGPAGLRPEPSRGVSDSPDPSRQGARKPEPAVDGSQRLVPNAARASAPPPREDRRVDDPPAEVRRQGLRCPPGRSLDQAPTPGRRLLHERFAALRPAVVVVAGLADGVNPCAFATLVFLVSMLTALRRSRRDVLVVGLCFTLAVFLAYLGLGFGALRALKVLAFSTGVSRTLALAVAGLALVLAGLSFRDALAYARTGDPESVSLKLPHALRLRINRLVSTRLRTSHLALAALSLGATVSVLESLCTGQVYLPTILFVLREPDLAPRALAWLVLYNLAFTVPLLAVFALAYAGLSTPRLLAFSRRHVGLSKFLLGMVFLGLGGLLLAQAL